MKNGVTKEKIFLDQVVRIKLKDFVKPRKPFFWKEEVKGNIFMKAQKAGYYYNCWHDVFAFEEIPDDMMLVGDILLFKPTVTFYMSNGKKHEFNFNSHDEALKFYKQKNQELSFKPSTLTQRDESYTKL